MVCERGRGWNGVQGCRGHQMLEQDAFLWGGEAAVQALLANATPSAD